MTKGSPTKKVSKALHDEALQIARSLQRPDQSKEETRSIAQGIQRGLEFYQKRQGEKTRELDKQLKKIRKQHDKLSPEIQIEEHVHYRQHWLPWLLLLISWIAFVVYLSVFSW